MSYRYPSLKRQRSEEQLNQTTPSSRNISVSMFESLQGSTDKLSSTLETLTKSVNILKALQPDVQRIRTITQTERKYEILTEKEIEEASHTISNETIPKIDMLLKKAQDIIDDMGDTSRDIEKKVDEQDFILGKQASKDQKGTIPSHLSDMDLEKLTALRMRTRKHQVKQEHLSREINECDASIQKLERELEQLNNEENSINRQQYQLQDENNSQTSSQLAASYNLEEKRLLEELGDLELQLKMDNTELMNYNNTNDNMDIYEESATLSISDYRKQLIVIQQLIDYLKDHPNVYDIQEDDLEKYLAALEHDKTKFNQVSQLENVFDNNVKQLISCSKTLMSQSNMGFVAQKLIEKIFKKGGQLPLTKELLLKEFQSSRQKEIAQAILNKYDFSSILV